MANWANPLITTQYDVFVAEVKDRDLDSATMFMSTSTNQPIGSVRFNRVTKIFEEWSGSAWVALIIGVAGGGTGASTGSGGAANLGLGTMAFQNSNGVNITGGAISALTWFSATTALLPSAHVTYDLGHGSLYWRNAFIGGGLVIPVGTDKYVVG